MFTNVFIVTTETIFGAEWKWKDDPERESGDVTQIGYDLFEISLGNRSVGFIILWLFNDTV
jgi:hypothetical protein